MSVSSIISVLILSNTLQMFIPCSKIRADNILDESLLERFPECSCHHVQLNSVHTVPLTPSRQYLCAIKSLPGHKQKANLEVKSNQISV